jgi:hypothetical protein
VSTTAEVMLGLIAVATIAIAAVQIGLVFVALRLARQMQDLRASFSSDIRPLIANLSAASNNAVRVSEMAVAQFQRADRVFGDLAHRVDDATRLVQSTLLAPLREGRALLAGVGAALGAMRDLRPTREEPLPTDDDALFIG